MAEIKRITEGMTGLEVSTLLYNNDENLNKDIEEHIKDTENPHEVTKKQVGLGNVDNTSDLEKPLSNIAKATFDTCVKKVTPSIGHKYLSFNTTYASAGSSDLLCHSDDTCWVNLRGSVLLKDQTVTINQWYEVCDLNTADGNGKKLIPVFPNISKDVYFEGCRVETSNYTKILFRITSAGKWEVYANTNSVFNSSFRVNINVGFANPPKS